MPDAATAAPAPLLLDPKAATAVHGLLQTTFQALNGSGRAPIPVSLRGLHSLCPHSTARGGRRTTRG
jgi:hypothetical protein